MGEPITEQKEDLKTTNAEEEEELSDEERALQEWARRILYVFVGILVVAFLCLYFYWGYHISRRITIYFLSRDAWNFYFWPFAGIRRPENIPKHQLHLM